MKRIGVALFLFAAAAHAGIHVTVIDRPPYYRDDPIRIRITADDARGVQTPAAENATVEREQPGVYRVVPRQAGVVTVGPFIAGIETKPSISVNVRSEISSSADPDEILLRRLEREGRQPVVVRVEVAPAAPVAGQVYDVTWRAACDGCVPQLDSHDLAEQHWRTERIEPAWNPESGIRRFDLYRAKLVAPDEPFANLPEMRFRGSVQFADGSMRLVTRIVPPLAITISPRPVPATIPVGDFELKTFDGGDIHGGWHPIRVVATGSGRLAGADPPLVELPVGVAYTVRPYDERVSDGAKGGFSRQWTYDIHSSDALTPRFTLHAYSPTAHARRDAVVSAAIPRPAPAKRRDRASAGLIPTLFFDTFLGATLAVALAISRRA